MGSTRCARARTFVGETTRVGKRAAEENADGERRESRVPRPTSRDGLCKWKLRSRVRAPRNEPISARNRPDPAELSISRARLPDSDLLLLLLLAELSMMMGNLCRWWSIARVLLHRPIGISDAERSAGAERRGDMNENRWYRRRTGTSTSIKSE